MLEHVGSVVAAAEQTLRQACEANQDVDEFVGQGTLLGRDRSGGKLAVFMATHGRS